MFAKLSVVVPEPVLFSFVVPDPLLIAVVVTFTAPALTTDGTCLPLMKCGKPCVLLH